MAEYFCDTSALVKAYLREPGSDRVVAITESDDSVVVSALSLVELGGALRAQQRAGALTPAGLAAALAAFADDLRAKFVRVAASDTVLEIATVLLDRNVLRAYDAVQLASCLWHASNRGAPVTFVCSDRQLLRAAAAEGLACLNPEDEG